MKYYFIAIFMVFVHMALGQKVDIEPSISPEFFSAEEEITITYNVSGTAMNNWSEAWLWAWLPSQTGIIPPSNINPASSDEASTDLAKMTSSTVDGKKYLSIKIKLTDFFGTSAGNIESVGFLIKGNDWSEGQTEDYITSVTNGFTLKFAEPTGTFDFYESGSIINIKVKTSELADIQLYLDDNLLTSVNNQTELNFEHAIEEDGEVHQLKASAQTDSDSEEITYSYSMEPNTPEVSLPLNVENGINYVNGTTAVLVLEAPNKNNVFLIGDFNDWTINNDYLMNKDGDQFWIELDNLESGKEYRFQYLVDGDLRIADPYAHKISSPYDDPQIVEENRYPGLQAYPTGKTTEAISFLQTNQSEFDWQSDEFTRPANEDLIIYELLIRDFTDQRSYQGVIDKLDYLADLGVNAIQLLPVMEFEGNLSWGYNPSFKLSADKYYGTEVQLKKLIDKAHEKGMAVILDIVLNHAFGRSPLVRLDNDDVFGPPTSKNPWLNRVAKHEYNVGYDFNHESQYTKDYVDRVNEFWIEEYHIDGYRFDLSKGFTQNNTLGSVDNWGKYDASRVALLKRMADNIWNLDDDAYIILEHLAENSEEKELADYGMMLWGNMKDAYVSLAKGNSSSINWLYHEERNWNDPHVVGYMESHDEERQIYEVMKSGTKSLAYTLSRAQLNAAFFFTVPGPKMLWQFGEFGYDEELNNDRLGIKPTHWEYLEDDDRRKLFAVYKSLISLRTKTDYIDEQYFSWQASAGNVKHIAIDHPEVKFRIVGNFSKEDKSLNPNTGGDGIWYDYFTCEAIEISDWANYEMNVSAGQFYILTSVVIDNYIEEDVRILSVENKKSTGMNIYPNPTEGSVRVESSYGWKQIRILDLEGRVIWDDQMQSVEYRRELNLDFLDRGAYLLELKTAEGKKTGRFVKR
ncbi:alpha-amylase family glycosyl hydrolase [Reichenbachiella sp.]|uniref:alpha-amylase family glycosyl hydrolase n=1 Tax=Reichenbachiella sp. TaxID=2184521 RepID=UPI003B5933B5